MVDDIYVSTENKETATTAKKLGAKCPFIRPKSLADKSIDLISVAKHTLEKIEKKNIFPDLIYVITESFPLREENLLKMMLNKLKKDGLETVAASKKEKAGIWLRDKSQKKFKNIVDNVTPGELREHESFIVPLGLGHLTYAHVLRAGKFLDKNYDLYNIKNSFSTTEVRDKKSFQNFLKLIN